MSPDASAQGRDPDATLPPHERRPGHVAIIMDGNGRWAEERGRPRIHGHQAGVKSVRSIAEAGAALQLSHLTLYAFSVDNWKRPQPEIDFLMRLLTDFLTKERPTLEKNQVRLTSIGRIDGMPDLVQKELRATEEFSAGFTGMNLCLALNYGGRTELVDAARALARRVQAGELEPDAIDEAAIAAHLYAPGTPDPDLLIRTGGEMRVSDFLLWEISYAEIVVTDVYWPEFTPDHLNDAMREYAGRNRRFGGLDPAPSDA
jgi:undecaprenyl diphosphate synthase